MRLALAAAARPSVFVGLSAAVFATLTAVSSAGAQSSVCADPGDFCSRQLDASCLARVGAGSVAAAEAGDCDAQFARYRDCLALVANQCGGGATPAPSATPAARSDAVDGATMTAVWEAIKDSAAPEPFERFAETYPGTPLAALASARADALRRAAVRSAPGPSQPPSQPFTQPPAPPRAQSAPRSWAQAETAIQLALVKFGSCVDAAGDPSSAAIVESVFFHDLADPMNSVKRSNPAPVDDAMLRHLFQASAGETPCMGAVVEELSVASPETAVVVAQLFTKLEVVNLGVLGGGMTVGAVNQQLEREMGAFTSNMFAAMALGRARMQQSQPAPETVRAALSQSLAAWADARQAVRAATPARLGVAPSGVARCDWAGAAVACAYAR